MDRRCEDRSAAYTYMEWVRWPVGVRRLAVGPTRRDVQKLERSQKLNRFRADMEPRTQKLQEQYTECFSLDIYGLVLRTRIISIYHLFSIYSFIFQRSTATKLLILKTVKTEAVKQIWGALKTFLIFPLSSMTCFSGKVKNISIFFRYCDAHTNSIAFVTVTEEKTFSQ